MQVLSVDEAVQVLTPLLQNGKLNAFVGSGISAAPPSKVPTWGALIRDFVKFFDGVVEDEAKGDKEFYAHLRELADAAKVAAKKADGIIAVATTLKDALVEFDKGRNLGIEDRFNEWLQRQFYAARPNELHSRIVRTGFSYILTTNYDPLLNLARDNAKIPISKLRQIAYHEHARLTVALHNDQSAIVYVHGTVGHIPLGNFVFTASDYAKMLIGSGPHAGFAMLLRTMFLTHSTLFLGYGGIDPHIESMLEEIGLHMEYNSLPGLPQQYEVVLRKNVNALMRRFKGRKRTQIIAIDDYADYGPFLQQLQSIAPRT